MADTFENFRKMLLKIYHLDHVNIISTHGLAWQAALKKNWIKLELLTAIDVLWMVEKDFRRRWCHANDQYVNANSKYIKN